MMKETRKRDGSFSDVAGEEENEFCVKRPRNPARFKEVEEEEEDDGDGDISAWLSMDDETVAELSKMLETETEPSPAFKVKFSCDPFSSPEIFQSSASYITINGDNDESCGSSFSESDSSVMASIDLGCWGVGLGRCGATKAVKSGGAWGEARGWVEENGEGCLMVGGDEKINGSDWCDGGGYDIDLDIDIDDDMLARFVGEDFLESQ